MHYTKVEAEEGGGPVDVRRTTLAAELKIFIEMCGK